MQPLAVDLPAVSPKGTSFGASQELTFPPKYGEHTRAVLQEAGCSAEEVTRLENERIIA